MRNFRALQPAVSLCLLLFAFTLTGCHARNGQGLTTVKFQTDWYPQPEHGGFYTALIKGYYKAEGLDVQIVPGGPYITSDPLVASGAVQFGMNSSDHIIEAIANADEHLVAVGATMQHDPQGILLHANSPVHTWTDLNGHTISVKPGSTWWEFIVKKFNLTNIREIPSTYSVANFIQDPNYIQQGFVTSEPFFAEKAGVPTRMLLNSDAGYDPYRVFYTSQDYLQQHPDIVAKFVRASIHGWRDYMADPTETNAAIQKLNPALNAEWMNFSYNALKKGNFITGASGNDTGQMDPARWQQMNQQLLDLHVIHHPVDLSQAYTTQFLK